MQLLRHREYIKTECTLIGSPILKTKALRIDANTKSLKQQFNCKSMKSCDYFKLKKNNFYFIEVSDFNQQLIDLSNKKISTTDKKYIKMEINLKLADTLLIFNEMSKKIKINAKNTLLKKKALLVACAKHPSDIVNFAYLERELARHYCPTHFANIKVIPYTMLETILKRR